MADFTRYRLAAAGGLALSLLLLQFRAAVQAQTGEPNLQRIRSADGAVRQAIDQGLERSATFRALVTAVQASSAVVYITRVPYLPGNMEGCVPLETDGASGYRYIRMSIRSGLTQERMTVVIGHELQHVLENLGAAAAGSEPAQSKLANMIPVTSSQYETQTALAVGQRIAAELRRANPRYR